MRHISMENISNKAICVDFIITKASTNPLTKERRWAATVSKFEADSQHDEVTKEFYEYATKMIESGEHPRPALVISHFDDPRYETALQPVPDEFAAGWATKLYIDGDQPKAKGIFANNELGDALYEAVKNDIASSNPKIRISMAFRATQDGVEKTEAGITRFKKGQIRHFAVTRYPVVRETDFMLEKSLTRRDDAESIVGPDLAEKLETAYKKIMKDYKTKSDYSLFEKAEDVKEIGKCISTKLKEGWERKRAIAACLEMTDHGMSKEKFDEWIDEIEKSAEELDFYEDDIEAVNLPKKAGTCYYALIAQGVDPQVALDRCYSQEARDMRDEAFEQENKTVIENQPEVAEEKEEVATDPVEEKSEEALPVVEELITEAPLTDETQPVAELESEKEELTEEPVQEIKSEETIPEVVESEIETQVTEELVTEEKSETPSEQEVESNNGEIAYPYQYETPNGKFKSTNNVDWIFEPIIEEKTEPDASESSIDDVNTEKTPVVSDEFDSLVNLFKSTVQSGEFGRKQKIEIVNSIFEKMSEVAYKKINETKPSNNDLEDMIHTAVEKAVTDAIEPYKAQIELLIAVNNELKSKSFNPPTPKRLVYKGAAEDMVVDKDHYTLEEVITKTTNKIRY